MEPDVVESNERKIPDLLYRAAVGALLFLVALLVGISTAHAIEIVPSVGVTKATTDGAETQKIYGLALRGSIAPFLRHETAIGYRSEEIYNGDLKLTMVPITESIWFAPLPVVYAGGGLGIYATSLTYRDVLLIPNTSKTSVGVHLGGGVNIPVAPMIAIDLNTRYVYMQEHATGLSQGNFDPDFWSTTAGIAIKF